MNDNEPFNYQVKTTSVYTITGDFRSGTKLEEFKKHLEDSRIKSDTFIFDLSKVTFMDSGSYRLVFELKKKGVVVNFDIQSKVFERYVDWRRGKK